MLIGGPVVWIRSRTMDVGGSPAKAWLCGGATHQLGTPTILTKHPTEIPNWNISGPAAAMSSAAVCQASAQDAL